MQTTIPPAYILLVIAAIALGAFYVLWSRRSTRTNDADDNEPTRIDRQHRP